MLCLICVIAAENGAQVLRVIVDLSRADFQPNDVQVVNYDSKLRVVARQEVTSLGGVTSRREFTRELDVTRPVARSTLRAVLQSGRLWIAGAIMPSSAVSCPDESQPAAAAAVASVLPSNGQPCCVELR